MVPVYPDVPRYENTEFPSVELRVWGDYAVYKAQCEALISTSNMNLDSVYRALIPKE